MTTRRKKWIAATVAMIALAGCVIVFSRPREPHFEGRSLTYWAARLDQVEGKIALTAIGTDALPFLIEWLDEKPTHFDVWTWRINNRLPSFLRPKPWPVGSRRDIAGNALGFLGTNAIPAIPDLIRTFDWKWAGGAPAFGQVALSEIGPAAIPALMQALDEDSARCYHVVDTLTYMGMPTWQGPRTTDEMRKIVAALDRIAGHPSPEVRLTVLPRLLWLDEGEVHEEVCRVWAKLLRDQSPEVRAAAEHFSPASPPPDLVAQLRNDPDANVRAAVERALQRAGRLGPMPEPVAQPSEP